MKKLITFLMLLTLFGVSSVWAADYVLSDVTKTGTTYTGNNPYYYTASFSNDLTVSYTRTETTKALTNGDANTIKYSNGYIYTVSGIPTNERITSITFYGYANADDKTADIYINGEDTGKDLQNRKTTYSTHTISDLSLSGGFTFKTVGSESAMIITITTTVIKSTPTLSFNYGTSCAAVIPANEASTTVYNALTTNSDGAVTWSVVDAGTTGATVSNESGTKGHVTVSAAGTATIRASVAESSTYNAGYLDYTLSVTKASVSTVDNFTIDISNLMMPVGVNANRDINRTIPRVTLTFGGGDGIKFNATDEFIIRNEGTFNVALRKSSDAAKINSIVLHGDFSKYTKANINENITASSGTIVKTNDNTLTWTAASGGADDVTFTSVKVSGVSATISSFDVTTNGEALDDTKVTPTFAFSPASAAASTAASGSYTTTLTSSPGFFNAISFNDDGTGTTLKGTDFIYGTPNTKYTLTSGTTAGSATLTASFAGNDYFNAVSATTYTLTVSAGKAELTDFSFNKDEATYTGTGGSIYVNSKELTNAGTSADPFTFVYDASRSTLKTKFFLDPSLTTIGAEANSTYFGVTSADATILDVSNATFSATNNGTRLYVDGINVLKAGTTSLTFTFKGSDNYNSKDVTVYFKAEEPITTYNGSYPYTWNFTNETSWTSSSIQSAYYNSQWERNGNAAKLASGSTSVSKDNGIDKIDGLAFNPTNGNQDKLWLNWNVNKVYIDGTMTVPNLSPDYEVSIQAPTGQTIKVGETTLTEKSGTYKYVPTATGDVTFTLNTDIYRVVVTRGAYSAQYTAITSTDLHEGVLTDGKYLIDEKERKLKGKWEFTGAGSLQGGTVITDVPGITMTIGRAEDTWTVVNDGDVLYSKTDAATERTTAVATAGNFYKFTPYVNGFLTLNGKNTNNHCYLMDGSSQVADYSGAFTGDWDITTYALKAGTTYYVVSHDKFYLHGFTFRPAFLDVDESTGELTNTDISTTYKQTYYAANLNKPANRFPHLITSTAGEGKVKFAGNRDIVNLEGDNDVVLIGNGNTIIKGTVLLEGSDEELFTYYYLQSTILNLSSTKFNGTDIKDQDYVDDNSDAADTYTFTFSTNIEKVNDDAAYKVYLRTDAGDETDITDKTVVSGTDITVTFDDGGKLVDGSTYRIRIAAGGIKASDDATQTNAEITRIFSINNAENDIPIKMIYPTGVATIGTSIVLETYDLKTESTNEYNDLIDNNSKYKGSGRIKNDNTGTVINVNFVISGRRLIAKPKATLENNTAYTLILDKECLITKDNGAILKKAKAFSFTTGASAGTQAAVVSTYPVNDPEGNTPMPVAYYNGGRISVTFDQAVELEPYSTAYATPVNGIESLTATTALSGEDASLKVDSDGKTVYWEFNTSDYLKYDLFYEIRIPANTVVASGGKPNESEITFRFRMPKNPDATAVDPDEFYPHTWDFNKFGDKEVSTTTAYNIAKNYGDPGTDEKRINSLITGTEEGYTKYTTKAQNDYGFDQGNDVYFNNKKGEKEIMDEFQGIRISLKTHRSDRFEIRDVTSKVTSNGSELNLDGTNKYIFRLNGDTHYMTLSNVPQGKLYMKVSCSKLIGINSPNATFVEDANFATTTHDNNTRITDTNGTKALVVDVKEAGDVIFCVGNFNCEKIGVAVDYKKALSSFENYFTDCQEPEMRYDLTGEFTSTSLTAYAVDGSGFKKGDTRINFTPLTNNVALAGEGTIIKASTEDTNIPIFCADVNTTATAHTTSLVGVVEDTYIERTDGDKRNYFFTNIAGKVDPESGLPVGEFTSSPLGFYRAVASTLGAHKSYLQLPLDQTNARSIIYINFDGEGETTGIRNLDNNATVQQEGAYYTLTGIRLNGKPSVKGIYILNGKKVMIK